MIMRIYIRTIIVVLIINNDDDNNCKWFDNKSPAAKSY